MGKIYAEILEEEAAKQYQEAMSHPSVVDGALMPDAHTGYSLPIGAVVAAKDFVSPAWVGYDIGCGMFACKLPVSKVQLEEKAKEVFDEIYKLIPVGFNKSDTETKYPIGGLTETGQAIAIKKEYKRALGTLGSGNHFIELGYDDFNQVWVVIHSGSRGVGHGIATHYMKLAHPDSKCKDGNFGFATDTQEGKDYIQDMNWALQYAKANRKLMGERVFQALGNVFERGMLPLEDHNTINSNHNHAEYDEDMDAWVHRKGATQAKAGMLGVIPGNMFDGSFIVVGRGNPDSLYSSSHGAGRVLSRKKAKESVSLEEFEVLMDGITAKVDESTLDESPFAYKNIFQVMELQKELVRVEYHIKPIINIKGYL